MNKQMNIVFSCDKNYFKHLCAVLVSILRNAKADREFSFKILSCDWGGEEVEKICKLKSIKNFDLELINVDKSNFEKMPLLNSEYMSSQTYFKYLICDIFKTLERVLYLDVDICVRGDLLELYNTDFEGNLAVVVGDFYKKIDELTQELGVKNYFNAGVMLFNLEGLRREKIAEKLFENTERMAREGKIKFFDQCVFNYTLDGRVKFVSPKYNAQLGLFQTIFQKMYSEDVLKAAIENPVIVHYTTEKKPWSAECPHPFKEDFLAAEEEVKKISENML